MLGPLLASVRARPRILIAFAVGLAVGILAPSPRIVTRVLLAWDAFTLIWLALAMEMFVRSDRKRLQARADRDDAGAVAVLALSIVAAVASMVAIGLELHRAKEGGGPMAAGVVVLTTATILLSWLFVHTIFAVHYAHDFYAGDDDRRGLKFPGSEDPNYSDFLYFSFNLGAAAQTSDVQVESSRLRTFVLVHTILSFLFNTTVLALAINVGASLI